MFKNHMLSSVMKVSCAVPIVVYFRTLQSSAKEVSSSLLFSTQFLQGQRKMFQNVDCDAGREQGLADLSADTELYHFYVSIY